LIRQPVSKLALATDHAGDNPKKRCRDIDWLTSRGGRGFITAVLAPLGHPFHRTYSQGADGFDGMIDTLPPGR
jgi:hypothetical protein